MTMLAPANPARLWFLRVATAAIPFVALALLEGALRLFGYGDDHALFVDSAESERYLMTNPDVIRRYFADDFSPALSIETNYFLEDKPPDALRLFVQGGSTAAGFPYGNDASIAGMLGARLRQRFPDRTIEVVNTAMSAVTSYTLLDFADEIIAREPDAVLIYAGHNEYLGIFGIGSAYSPTGWRPVTLLTLELDGLRLYQLMRNLYVGARLLIDEPEPPDATTLMGAIARDRSIALGSARYVQGIEQFEKNIARLADKYRAAGVPVFIATIASNVADQPPFVSSALADDAARALASARAAIAAGGNDDSVNAPADLEDLAERDASADLHFAAGDIARRQADFDRARRHYTNARDLDLLRFRAPSAINETIRSLAAKRGVNLVDVHARLESAAEHELIGSGLMLEHLHPNAEGYALIADAFYDALNQSLLPGDAPRPIDATEPGSATRSGNTTQAGNATRPVELPILPAEIYLGEAATAHLKSEFPFVMARQEPVLPPIVSASDEIGYALYEGSISWLGAAEESRLIARDPDARALASTLIAEARPFRPNLNVRAASDLLSAERPAESLRYFRRAIAEDAGRIDYRLGLVEAYRRLDRRADALEAIDAILALEPDNADAIAARDVVRSAPQRQ